MDRCIFRYEKGITDFRHLVSGDGICKHLQVGVQ